MSGTITFMIIPGHHPITDNVQRLNSVVSNVFIPYYSYSVIYYLLFFYLNYVLAYFACDCCVT